jgi:hypothetical protein
VSRHDRYILSLVLARWGFAALVAIAILVGFLVAATVSVPDAIPSVALRAAPVYRVEVGAAVFLGLYLAALVFALSLHNRGFTEIGSGGAKARDLAAAGEAVSIELLEAILKEVDLTRERQEGSPSVR